MRKRTYNKSQLIAELDEMRHRVAELEKSHTLSAIVSPEKQSNELVARELFNSMFKNSTFGLALIDLEGKVVAVNETQCALLGYTENELLGMFFPQFTHPDDVEWHLQLYGELLRGERESFSLDKRIIRRDGQIRWLRLGVSLVRDNTGRPQNGVVIYADISDQKQTEELLREQNELLQASDRLQARYLAQIQEEQKQLRAILNTVPEGILLLNSDYGILLSNPLGMEYLSILAGTMLNGRVARLGDRPIHELLTSPPIHGTWHEVTAGDRQFVTIVRPVQNGPETERWVLVLHEVTAEREIQRRIQQQDRLAIVGQLAAGIAHDFNNILAIITLDADLMLLSTPQDSPHVNRLETIVTQARQASQMIQQILDFSRRSSLARNPLPLKPFLQEQVKLLRRVLPDNIYIRMEPSTHDLVILADPTRIQQIIMNLVVNARDAMPAGGLIRLKLDVLEIVHPHDAPIEGMQPGYWVRLQVSDNGPGIPTRDLPHLFEPFFTTKPPGKGSGLGLAQVYGLVHQHGGEIAVESTVDTGTAFNLYFPVEQQLQMIPEISPLPMIRAREQYLILLVEDNNELREVAGAGLQSLGYSVMEARNGLEALAVLEKQASNIALILSDVVMPEMGGQGLFYALQEKGLAIPVVLMTGHPIEAELNELRQQGLAAWIAKPLNLRQLGLLLDKVLMAI